MVLDFMCTSSTTFLKFESYFILLNTDIDTDTDTDSDTF